MRREEIRRRQHDEAACAHEGKYRPAPEPIGQRAKAEIAENRSRIQCHDRIADGLRECGGVGSLKFGQFMNQGRRPVGRTPKTEDRDERQRRSNQRGPLQLERALIGGNGLVEAPRDFQRLGKVVVRPNELRVDGGRLPVGGYRGLENRLYRVEIHEGGALGVARFKWSRDNGSTVMALTHPTAADSTTSAVMLAASAASAGDRYLAAARVRTRERHTPAIRAPAVTATALVAFARERDAPSAALVTV